MGIERDDQQRPLVKRWGFTPIRNFFGVRSKLGGSLVLPEVSAEMQSIENLFIDMHALSIAAGKTLAELTGSEAGLVTAGAAAALTLFTAATIAGNNPVAALSLPKGPAGKRLVAMLPEHISPYDIAVTAAGGDIFRLPDIASLVENADKIALAIFVGVREAKGSVAFDTFRDKAHSAGIPVLVDAASEFLTFPEYWISRSADAVTYSGGKRLGGPSGAAILLGSSKLIARASAFNSPHFGIARNMKVTKEEIVGMVKAVEVAKRQESPLHNALRRELWATVLRNIQRGLSALEGISCKGVPPSGRQPVPRLEVQWDMEKFPISGFEMAEQLRQSSSSIVLEDMWIGNNSFVVDPFCSQPGDDVHLVAELLDEFRKAMDQRPFVVQRTLPDSALIGKWRVLVDTEPGPLVCPIEIAMDGTTECSLFQVTEGGPVPIGSARGPDVLFISKFQTPYMEFCLRFSGISHDGKLSGVAEVGQMNEQGVYFVDPAWPNYSWRAVRQ